MTNHGDHLLILRFHGVESVIQTGCRSQFRGYIIIFKFIYKVSFIYNIFAPLFPVTHKLCVSCF